MSDSRQAFWGFLAALMSVVIIFGSLAISMVEGGIPLARAFTPTNTLVVDTPKPGEPTFTPSPTPPPTDTPTPPPPESPCDTPPDWIPVTVQFGDTLSDIARTYSTEVDILKQGNCLETDGLMPDGRIVFVPSIPPTSTSTATSTATLPPPPPTSPPPTSCGPPRGWVLYTVRSGDNLFRLSLELGVSIPQLQRANCLDSPDKIRAGSRIWVPRLPVRKPSQTPTQRIKPSNTPTSPPPTATSSPTTEATLTSRPTNTPTFTPTPSITPTPSLTLTPTNTPIPPTATDTPMPTPTPTSSPTPSETPPPTPTNTPTQAAGLNITVTIIPRSTSSTLNPTMR